MQYIDSFSYTVKPSKPRSLLSMVKKILLSLLTFVVVGACIVGVGFALEPESGFHTLDENAACPVVGCASES